MKKITNLLLIIPMITGCGSFLNANAEATEVSLTSAQINTLKTFFRKPVSYITSSRDINIEMQYSTTRCNVNYFSDDLVLYDETYFKDTSTGLAKVEYLDISNKVASKDYLDEDGNTVSYDAVFVNPMRNINTVTEENFNEYFTTSFENPNYVIEATDKGNALFSQNFLSMLYFEAGIIDYLSGTTFTDNIKIKLTSEGDPFLINYDVICQDKYGATKSNYTVFLTQLDEVKSVTAASNKLDETEETKLQNGLTSLQSKLDEGNFTMNVKLSADIAGAQEIISYNNYYHLDGESGKGKVGPLMLSDLVLYDSSRGNTYCGIKYTTDMGYFMYAVSPQARYDDAMNSTSFASIRDVVPFVGEISPEFFEAGANENFYVAEFYGKSYATQDLYFTLYQSLLSSIDAALMVVDLYYSTTNGYLLHSMQAMVQEDTMTFIAAIVIDNNMYYLTVNYTDFGTTDIHTVESLQPAIEYLLSK